jgi:uncharacterized protein YjgD (DUF1641 family)
MAQAVAFREFTPQNSREDLLRRIHEVPADHADALLAAFALLQKFHDAGLLSLASGLISAGSTIIDRLSDVADSPQAVTALRTTLILGSVLNTLDANELRDAMQVGEKDASLWHILKGLTTKESRQLAMIGVNLMNVIGRAMARRNAVENKIPATSR